MFDYRKVQGYFYLYSNQFNMLAVLKKSEEGFQFCELDSVPSIEENPVTGKASVCKGLVCSFDAWFEDDLEDVQKKVNCVF